MALYYWFFKGYWIKSGLDFYLGPSIFLIVKQEKNW